MVTDDQTLDAGAGLGDLPQDGSVGMEGLEGTDGTDSNAGGMGGSDAPADAVASTFYNPKDVPEGLRPTFVEMQGAFTKKTQRLSAQLKEADAFKYHAGLFNELMADQRVVGFLEQLDSTDSGDAPSAGGSGSEDTEVSPEFIALKKQVGVLSQELNRTRQKGELSDERSRFVRAHPDWQEYKGGMDQAWKLDSNRTMEDAYNWSVVSSLRARQGSAANQRRRADASVERPGSGQDALRPAKPGSFRSAARAALDEHGLDRSQFGM